MARQRTLTPLIGVRIPVPQPRKKIKGIGCTGLALFSLPSYSIPPSLFRAMRFSLDAHELKGTIGIVGYPCGVHGVELPSPGHGLEVLMLNCN